MSRQALASEAAPGARPLQQLHALAHLHEHVRETLPAIDSELCMDATHLPPGAELDSETASFSPISKCAVAVWNSQRNDEATGQLVRERGVLVVGKHANGGTWSSLLPSAEGLMQCSCGISGDGRYAVTLCQPEGAGDATARVFDTHMHTPSWLPGLPVEGCGVTGLNISVCDTGDPLLAAVPGYSSYGSTLIIFGVLQPFARVLPEIREFHWLTGSHFVLLLTSTHISRLYPLSGAAGERTAPLPFASPRHWAMALPHDARTVWVAVTAQGRAVEGFRRTHLVVWTTSDMVQQGIWLCNLPVTRLEGLGLHVTPLAVAVDTGSGVWVCGLAGPCTLGATLFLSQLSGASFSADARFMLGTRNETSLVVLDARTGRPAAEYLFNDLVDEESVESVLWRDGHPGQAVIVYYGETTADLTFCLLQF